MPDDRKKLTPEEREALLRRAWYGHDGRWFAAVAAEYGLDAANRLNRAALRAASRGEMRGIARAFGVERAADLDQFFELFDVGAEVFVPRSLMEFEVRRLNDRSYEARFERCFVHENVTRAGIGEHYVCAVFERLAGWHEALGLPLEEEPPALPCAKARGEECRRIMTLK
jgi:hypothetical protein